MSKSGIILVTGPTGKVGRVFIKRRLVRFSQLITGQRWIKELDINPLMASPEKLLALVRVSSSLTKTQKRNNSVHGNMDCERQNESDHPDDPA